MSSWAEFAKTIRPENHLHIFARSGEVEALRKTVSPENVNEQDPRGHSALTLACYNGHVEAAEFLLSRGADPDLRDYRGNTVLMGAAFKGHLEVVKLLITHGADARLTNPQGLTARGFAELFGRHDVVSYLTSVEIQ